MEYSGIGGQAVMEGVMMRNGDDVAVAVRLTDGTIHVDEQHMKPEPEWVKKTPIIRGIYAFFHSLIVGIRALYDSSSYFDDEDDSTGRAKENDSKEETEEERLKREKTRKHQESLAIGGSFIFSLVLALLIFFALPFYLSKLVGRVVTNVYALAFIEGLFRVMIFLIYIAAIAKMEDIRRVFMYHGAEHKCINCVEHGLPLTVENVRKSSRFHKRCGTSFIFIVLLVSIFVFMFIRTDVRVLQLLYRLLLIPVISGISFEFIRVAGRSDNKVINALSKPGLLIQRLTTREPDDSMIEVGIASVEKVFDWKDFLKTHF